MPIDSNTCVGGGMLHNIPAGNPIRTLKDWQKGQDFTEAATDLAMPFHQ